MAWDSTKNYGDVIIETDWNSMVADQKSRVLLSGNETIEGIKTFTQFPVTPSSAPTSNYQVANKKYVDDNGTDTDTLKRYSFFYGG